MDDFDAVDSRVEIPITANYNVAPTDEVYIVLGRGVAGSGAERAEAYRRTLAVARWGLVPSWAKDRSMASRLINARSDTLADKPAFRRAYASRRCLVPADGYYEWPVIGESSVGKPIKQPYYLTPLSGEILPMAGLYEWWKDPAKREGDPDRWLLSCTVITTAAADDTGVIHDRMPLVLRPEDWTDWLDPTLSDVADLLHPATEFGMTAYPVSTLVNSVRNNGPKLTAPLELR